MSRIKIKIPWTNCRLILGFVSPLRRADELSDSHGEEITEVALGALRVRRHSAPPSCDAHPQGGQRAVKGKSPHASSDRRSVLSAPIQEGEGREIVIFAAGRESVPVVTGLFKACYVSIFGLTIHVGRLERDVNLYFFPRRKSPPFLAWNILSPWCVGGRPSKSLERVDRLVRGSLYGEKAGAKAAGNEAEVRAGAPVATLSRYRVRKRNLRAGRWL